ncbi:hypothetical protein ACGLFO_13030 [Corynebacterium hesseae]|uniref:hypothetical protein n=1 Tax=Corynebacterium hesseae TaxID=2913502 RepID=UPI00373F337F
MTSPSTTKTKDQPTPRVIALVAAAVATPPRNPTTTMVMTAIRRRLVPVLASRSKR